MGHIHLNNNNIVDTSTKTLVSIIDTEIWINNKHVNIAMLRFEVNVFKYVFVV